MSMRLLKVLVVMLLAVSAVGCKGRGGPQDKTDWERAYRHSGSRVVVDRFEIDVRNTKAIDKVIDYQDRSAVISARGQGMITTLDGLEVFAVSPGIRKGLRKTSNQDTVRQTYQFVYELRGNHGVYKVPFPAGSDSLPVVLGPSDNDAAWVTDREIHVGPALTYEEGVSIATVLRGQAAADDGPQSTVLQEFNLFFKPNRSIVIRTAPLAGNTSALTFERDGQTYETVFVITYVDVRTSPKPLREYFEWD